MITFICVCIYTLYKENLFNIKSSKKLNKTYDIFIACKCVSLLIIVKMHTSHMTIEYHCLSILVDS